MGKLTGQVAFITGARRGISRAIAQRFAAEGASVVLGASGIARRRPDMLEPVEMMAEAAAKNTRW